MDSSQEAGEDKVGETLNAQRFHMLEDIAKELEGDVVFPTCFDAAFRMRKELQNPDLSIPQIASIVGCDPLIASKLIQLANSVLYSPDGIPARNLGAAVNRLGVQLVRTTAQAIAMRQLLRSKDMAVFGDLAHDLWNHSLKTAVACRVLACSQTRINPDEALLAGLVHDLGAFYMLYRAAQYPELLARLETVKYLMVQWHESIGVTLLKALDMPEAIVDATIDHDQWRELPTVLKTLGDIVYVGNILAGAVFEWTHQEVVPDAGDHIRVFQRFEDLLLEIETGTREMQAVFA